MSLVLFYTIGYRIRYCLHWYKHISEVSYKLMQITWKCWVVLVQTELNDECLAYIVFGSDECFVGRSHLLGSIYRSFWISSVLPRNVFWFFLFKKVYYEEVDLKCQHSFRVLNFSGIKNCRNQYSSCQCSGSTVTVSRKESIQNTGFDFGCVKSWRSRSQMFTCPTPKC